MDWHAEADRLRAGIEAFLSGDADTMPRAVIWRKDGMPSKHDQCPHGQYMWEGCEACADEYFQRLLKKRMTEDHNPDPEDEEVYDYWEVANAELAKENAQLRRLLRLVHEKFWDWQDESAENSATYEEIDKILNFPPRSEKKNE